MTRRFVKPAEGLAVPDPDHGDDLPPEGRAVNWSPYWARRERDKDVTVTKVPKPGARAVTDQKSKPASSGSEKEG